MRRLAGSWISSGDQCAASATTTKEGTTGKCYPSPEYNLLPITWTVQPMKVARVPPFTSTLGALTGSLSPTAIAKPHGTRLGTRPEPPAPAPTRLAVPLCSDEKRPRPTDAGGALEPPTLWFWKTGSSLTRVAQPNESRLSCGALKKDSFHNLRAPSASSACYAAGAPRSEEH